jgi:DNA-binding MarR family transcriptional regulator
MVNFRSATYKKFLRVRVRRKASAKRAGVPKNSFASDRNSLDAGNYGDMPIIVKEVVARIFSPCHCNVLRKAARHVSHTYDLALQPTGLKTTQFSLLAAIDRRRDNPPTMQELAEVMVMDRSTLGHELRPLERDHLVQLRINASDRRSRQVFLTGKGRSKLQEAAGLWREMQQRFESAFGTERTARLREDLLVLATMNFSSVDSH